MDSLREKLIEALDPFFSAADRAYGEPAKAADAVLNTLKEPGEEVVREVARAVDPSLWSSFMAYSGDIESDEQLGRHRRQAIATARSAIAAFISAVSPAP